MPQLRETGLNALPHLREQELAGGRIGARDKQDLCLLLKQLSSRLAPITQVSDRHAPVARFAEREQRVSVINRAGCQHDIEKAARHVAQAMQLEAEEPALTCFPEARAVLSHQAHPPMPKLM